MAPALQCPRCAAKHPLDRHAGDASFPCSQCGQLLKVPEQFRAPSRPATASTSVLPAARGPRTVWRVLAWVVAVLLGGFIVLVAARAVGYLDGQRALDVVISRGFSRYLVLLPLVPIWAVVTTILVTIFLDGGQALARRRSASRAVPSASCMPQPPRARPSQTPPVPDDRPPPRRRTEGRRAGGRRAGGHPEAH